MGKLLLGISFADDLELSLTLLGLSTGRNLSMAYFMLPNHVQAIYWTMTVINLMWGLLNLLPILPLMAAASLRSSSSWRTRGKACGEHIVSLLTAGILAMVFFRWNQTGAGIWFAYFAFQNYQVLQALHQSAKYGLVEDDADWWKR